MNYIKHEDELSTHIQVGATLDVIWMQIKFECHLRKDFNWDF